MPTHANAKNQAPDAKRAGGVQQKLTEWVQKPTNTTVTTPEWKWPRIQSLIDQARSSLSNGKRLVMASNPFDSPEADQIEDVLYGLLPDGVARLREIRDEAKRLHREGIKGSKQAKEVLGPYMVALEALVWACRLKLGRVICESNPQGWCKEAFALYQELQINLKGIERVHHLSSTFASELEYAEIKQKLKSLRGNLLLRDCGFQSASVISQHGEGRLHCHILFWSFEERTVQAETAAIKKLKRGLGGYGFGEARVSSPHQKRGDSRIKARAKITRYFPYNYDEARKQPRGGPGCIPKRAAPLCVPECVRPGQPWTKVGKIAILSSWDIRRRKGVAEYARRFGLPDEGNWRWIGTERKAIRRYIPREQFRLPSVTGLDGYTYGVYAAGTDHLGNETYEIRNEERGSYLLTEHGLSEIAKLSVAFGALPKKPLVDPVDGRPYDPFKIHGFKIPASYLPCPKAAPRKCHHASQLPVDLLCAK